MKKFDNLNNLFEYCFYCPICQDNCRQIESMQFAPDYVNYLNKDIIDVANSKKPLDKLDFQLQIGAFHSSRKIKSLPSYQLTIDIANNKSKISKFNHNFSDVNYLYFYIHSSCKNCFSYINTSDVELNFVNSTISNISIENETFFLFKTENKYLLSYYYDEGIMNVSKLYADNERIFPEHKKHMLPIMNFDFLNQEKAANRIKTILTFK